ncbi:MAG: DUF3313 family protein [Hyphomonadaceae bacterium]|nr:DUF3313 family protein [Hyphomonadaceae bacterium]
MRSVLFGFTALALAQTAWAEPVAVSPISFSPQLETALAEDLGPREGEYLQRAVQTEIAAALQRRGVSAGAPARLSIEVVIVDADPNRPTMQQLHDQPGLDPIASVSIGGAELRAILRDNDGNAVATVEHRFYDHNLLDTTPAASTWSTARRSIHRFARRVADAYVAHGG